MFLLEFPSISCAGLPGGLLYFSDDQIRKLPNELLDSLNSDY